jgi:hypothetical protein
MKRRTSSSPLKYVPGAIDALLAACCLLSSLGCQDRTAQPRAITTARSIISRHGIAPVVIGCYSLETTSQSAADASTYLERARWFRLDPRPASSEHPQTHVVATPVAESLSNRMSFWTVDSASDSIRVSFADGLTGVALTLVPVDSGLMGPATAFGDYGPWQRSLGLVRAHRMPCRAQRLTARGRRRAQS